MSFIDIINIALKIPSFLVSVAKILKVIKTRKNMQKRESAESLAQNSADNLT